MNISVQEEMTSRMKLINHILSGNFFGEEFCRYSIEVSKGDKLITTRLWRFGNEFSIKFILQDDKCGSWEDVEDMGFIEYVKGNMHNINDVITDEVFNSIIPTMIDTLNKMRVQLRMEELKCQTTLQTVKIYRLQFAGQRKP